MFALEKLNNNVTCRAISRFTKFQELCEAVISSQTVTTSFEVLIRRLHSVSSRLMVLLLRVFRVGRGGKGVNANLDFAISNSPWP